MKAWPFLDDVTDAGGPLAYWPGSHRRTPRREAWERRRSIEAADPQTRRKGGAFRVTSAEMRRMGYGEPERFAVAANTLVVADTFGVHCRTRSLQPSARIEIWASSRHNPFRPWAGGHWLAGMIGARAVTLNWRLTALRRRLGLPAPDLRLVEDVGAQDPPAPWGAEARAQVSRAFPLGDGRSPTLCSGQAATKPKLGET